MKAAGVQRLLSGLLAQQSPFSDRGSFADLLSQVESVTVVGDHRLVVTFTDRTRVVVTIGIYQARGEPGSRLARPLTAPQEGQQP